MNEQIKELKDQCYICLIDRDDDNEYDMEKFAELIILECDKFVTTNFHDSGMTLGAKMKKHFGVNDES